jgi:branched-chain amino acid transport system substrate-binding protein
MQSPFRQRRKLMLVRSRMVAGLVAIGLTAFLAEQPLAQDTIKVGLILPMTGPQQSTGAQVAAAARLYMQQHGNLVEGRKIELVLRDDMSVPDNTKRIAQELIVNEKVAFIAGFGVTPSMLAVAPLATEARVPTIIMAAGPSIATNRSPYIVRTSFSGSQSDLVIADWAARNGIRSVVTIVADYTPGVEHETYFKEAFVKAGGRIVESIRYPLQNPDFAPFLQRSKDAKPDAILVFVLSGQGGTFLKQFIERGIDNAGIKLIGSGDVTDDDLLPAMSDAALGTVTAHFYSAAHPSEMNRAYVDAFKKATGTRPNFMSVGGYDGMHLIYEALKKTGGRTNGDSLIAAMKGMAWESPRGPVAIDPQTRDIVQNIYLRKVEKLHGELYNVEFATFEAVKGAATATKD